MCLEYEEVCLCNGKYDSSYLFAWIILWLLLVFIPTDGGNGWSLEYSGCLTIKYFHVIFLAEKYLSEDNTSCKSAKRDKLDTRQACTLSCKVSVDH